MYICTDPSLGHGVDTWEDRQTTWAEAQAQQAATDALDNLDIIDVTKPVPFPFEKDGVVFICVDIEAWEKNNSKITEIGICSLDTRQLVGQRPGKDGRNWFSKLVSRHFRLVIQKSSLQAHTFSFNSFMFSVLVADTLQNPAAFPSPQWRLRSGKCRQFQVWQK